MPEPLVIWRLTDGKPGHMQQTLGLVRALSALQPCEIVDIDVAAQPVGVRDALLGRFMPGVAKKKPDLILGAGHATHFALLAARRAVGGRAVALMKPSLPAFLFDFIVVPEHDGLTEDERIINTVGVLNAMAPGEKKVGSVLLLVGGPSKHVHWDDAAILQAVDVVVGALEVGAPWCISDSRRTPPALSRELLQRYGERFQSFSTCPPGWLGERLKMTETVWVSEDSVSMVYEALTASCRVGLLRLPETAGNSRVMRGVEKLIDEGRVTTFQQWSRTSELKAPIPLDEATRVAQLLLQRIGRKRVES